VAVAGMGLALAVGTKAVVVGTGFELTAEMEIP
jgi:hypothetical protein